MNNKDNEKEQTQNRQVLSDRDVKLGLGELYAEILILRKQLNVAQTEISQLKKEIVDSSKNKAQ